MQNERAEEHKPSPEELAAMDEYIDMLNRGEAPDLEGYLARFPEFEETLRPVLEAARELAEEKDEE